MAVTRAWKVYGLPGHRQRESFFESVKYDFSVAGDVRIIELENSDKTGTNEYTIIRITRNTSAEDVDRKRLGRVLRHLPFLMQKCLTLIRKFAILS